MGFRSGGDCPHGFFEVDLRPAGKAKLTGTNEDKQGEPGCQLGGRLPAVSASDIRTVKDRGVDTACRNSDVQVVLKYYLGEERGGVAAGAKSALPVIETMWDTVYRCQTGMCGRRPA